MSAPPLPPVDYRLVDLFVPKLVTAFRDGYRALDLRRDAVAGLTVAIVALPLAMAIGIASGATPDKGLITAIVAGFLISALGGSRFQIGGPTAAFIVVVFETIEKHGYGGLLLATLIAGLILIVVGLLRLGTYIKYIPYPVVIGFTAGIAVSIFASQVKDLLGLEAKLPAAFIPKMEAIFAALGQTRAHAVGIAIVTVAVILVLRRFRPGWPGYLIAVAASSGLALVLGLEVATIGSAFGGVPQSLPMPSFAGIDFGQIGEVIPDALTIALLAGVELLLSAVIADGMTGRRHRSNAELVAQGIANVASVAFGGLPATGAIARTATNIRAGARSPVAGILHAVFLLLFILIAAPILSYVPLAALAAILALVAWNIAEVDHIRTILTRAGMGDRVVLLLTFFLTVLVDLTVGIEVGVVLASFLFMHRMANAVEVEANTRIIEEDRPDGPPRETEPFETSGPAGDTLVYRINGPFFFGATQKFSHVIESIGRHPSTYILDFSGVPFVDLTAATTLRGFLDNARRHGARVVIAAASDKVRQGLIDFGIKSPDVSFAPSANAALAPRQAPH